MSLLVDEPADTRRVKWTKRMAQEPQWRNQYISAFLPTLPYVPHIELTQNSKYVMRPPHELPAYPC